MRRIMVIIILSLGTLFLALCGGLTLFQEKFIFFPEKLDKSFSFEFEQKFEEVYIEAEDGIVLHGLLFPAENSKGLVFYLHGNAGSLRSWGGVAQTFTDLHYHAFILDYRGYGKSEGDIQGEERFFQDIQTVYNKMKQRFDENGIVVIGYSIGTGAAAKIASENNPRMLILQAPYYNLSDLMRRIYPGIPSFILKYKFRTDRYITKCRMPVILFHGNRDEVIYYGSSLKLQKLFKPEDRLITLDGQSHNGMTDNPDYQREIRKILE